MRTVVLLIAALLGLQAAPVTGKQDARRDAGFDRAAIERARVLPVAGAAPKVAVSLPAGEAVLYFIDLPSNVSGLTVGTSGSGGDVDLFVRQGVPHLGSTLDAVAAESIGFSATPGNLESVAVDRGDGLAPGRWWVLLINQGTSAAQLELTAETTTAGAPFSAGIGQSGTWYEQAKTYQGLFIQYLSAAQAIVVWFTFTEDGEQAWLLGAGVVQGDRLVVEQFAQSRGGRFGDAFDPDQVVLEDVGDLVVTFDSCGHGYASFGSSRADWPHEQLEITRLTGVDGLGCNGSSKASFVGSGMSGSWYNPERSGEGWLVQVLSPELAVGYWFTYDADGNQAWVGGVGTLVDGSLVLPEVVQPVGGRFGPGYSPSQVTLQPWGAMAMTFTGCNAATMTAIGPPEFGDYGDPLWARLSSIAGTPSCDLRTAPVDLAAMLSVAPFSSSDGDANDPNTPNVDNDTPSQPQALGNPQVVAGFLAATGTGISGDRFASSTDVLDAYRLPITAGQTIQLVISDWNAGNPGAVDFDVYLYAASNPAEPVQTALGTGRNEFMTVAATGNYDIVVQAFAGHGNYVLAVTDAPAPANAQALSLETGVVPGELIVRFDEPWDDGRAPTALYKSVLQREQALGLSFIEGQPGRPQLFGVADAAALAKLGGGEDTPRAMRELGWGLADVQAHRLLAVRALKALRSRSDVRYAEPNRLAHAQAIPTDPLYPQQWHYPMVNLPQAWDIGSGSSGVVVAVVDTGVNPHPDLAANLRVDLSVDMISNLSGAADGNGPDRNAQDPGDGVPPTPDSFHGTHVAGTVAALANNGRGGTGVAPGVRIMPVRVLGRGGTGSFNDITNGILWAAGEAVLGAQAGQPADVINLSLGGSGACSGAVAEAVARARSAGVIVIAAAGNENTPAAVTPADCPGVVKVAAVGRDYLPANYSNCAGIDVAAPGGEDAPDAQWAAFLTTPPLCKGSLGGRHSEVDAVLSTVSSRSNAQAELHGFKAGTSMAAPHVAGLAALMRSVHPALSPADFDAMLAGGELSFDPRDVGVVLPGSVASQYSSFYGNGIIDALAGVRAAQARAGGSGGAVPAALVVQPSALFFGSVTDSLSFDVMRVGSGTVAVQSVSVDVPWLSGSGGGADGLGRYTLSVDRSGLAEADYSGRVVVQPSSGAPIVVPVSMRVGDAPDVGSSGQVYALLLDAITFQPVRDNVSVSGASGQARMAWPDVYPGTYYLVYGTDNDNDFFICDAGEFCGFVPFGDSLQPLQLREDTEIGFAPLVPDLDGVGSASDAGTGKSLLGRNWKRSD